MFSCLSRFQSGSLPYDLRSVRGAPKKRHWFQFNFFLVVSAGMTTPILFMCQSLVNENTLSTELWKLPPSLWFWFSVWVLGNPSFMAISKLVQPRFACFFFLLEIFAKFLLHTRYCFRLWSHSVNKYVRSSLCPFGQNSYIDSPVPTSSFRLDLATLSQKYITCSSRLHPPGDFLFSILHILPSLWGPMQNLHCLRKQTFSTYSDLFLFWILTTLYLFIH